MRGPSVLFIVLALSGCVVHSPQMAQYKAEYSNRQDIHSHSLIGSWLNPLNQVRRNTGAQAI